MVVADAYRQSGVKSSSELAPDSNRAVKEYLAVLDDAAFGGATPVEPKLVSPKAAVIGAGRGISLASFLKFCAVAQGRAVHLDANDPGLA
jgi:hypothetical protein